MCVDQLYIIGDHLHIEKVYVYLCQINSGYGGVGVDADG